MILTLMYVNVHSGCGMCRSGGMEINRKKKTIRTEAVVEAAFRVFSASQPITVWYSARMHFWLYADWSIQICSQLIGYELQKDLSPQKEAH